MKPKIFPSKYVISFLMPLVCRYHFLQMQVFLRNQYFGIGLRVHHEIIFRRKRNYQRQTLTFPAVRSFSMISQISKISTVTYSTTKKTTCTENK